MGALVGMSAAVAPVQTPSPTTNAASLNDESARDLTTSRPLIALLQVNCTAGTLQCFSPCFARWCLLASILSQVELAFAAQKIKMQRV
jgi:hypothetical protein